MFRFNTSIKLISRFFSSAANSSGPLDIASLGLKNEAASKFLSEMSIRKPSEIQSLAIKTIMTRDDAIIAAPTGTGKTLAYLLPIMEMVKEMESVNEVTRPSRPRALVIVPTRELSTQVEAVAKKAAHSYKLRVRALCGGERRSSQKDLLAGPMDILVTTPGRALAWIEAGNLFLSEVQHVVLDEADTLCDETFKGETNQLLQPLLLRREATKAGSLQLIFVVATLTRQLRNFVESSAKGAKIVSAAGLHHTVPQLRQKFVDVFGNDKEAAMLTVLKEDLNRRTLIFTRSPESCRAVGYMVSNLGISVACLHSDMPAKLRETEFERFSTAEAQILVATDIAARGLDVSDIARVICFDFPKSVTEYLHRAGRTARAGSPGTVVTLVTPSEKTQCEKLQVSLKRGECEDEAEPRRSSTPRIARIGPGGTAALRQSLSGNRQQSSRYQKADEKKGDRRESRRSESRDKRVGPSRGFGKGTSGRDEPRFETTRASRGSAGEDRKQGIQGIKDFFSERDTQRRAGNEQRAEEERVERAQPPRAADGERSDRREGGRGRGEERFDRREGGRGRDGDSDRPTGRFSRDGGRPPQQQQDRPRSFSRSSDSGRPRSDDFSEKRPDSKFSSSRSKTGGGDRRSGGRSDPRTGRPLRSGDKRAPGGRDTGARGGSVTPRATERFKNVAANLIKRKDRRE